MSGFVVTEGERVVDADVERIAAIIKEYDPDLELAWVPPERRELNEDFPFAVIHRNPDYVCFRLRANEVDHRVLKRLWDSDNAKGNVLSAIEAEEAALRAVELRKQMDELEEQQELAAWMIKARPGQTYAKGKRLE